MSFPSVAAAHKIDQALARARDRLFALQAPDGHWVGELEADTSITSEWIMLQHLQGRVDRAREAKAVRYLLGQQRTDGGFTLYPGGPTNLSTTLKAYLALKLAGADPEADFMRTARNLIREAGGPTKANVFTKIALAFFGEYDWRGVPAMPVEIMLLPRWFYVNLAEVSYWSRTVIVPLLIIMEHRPVHALPRHLSIDECWPVPRAEADLAFPRDQERWPWKNLFVDVDRFLRAYEAWGPRPLRRRALRRAEAWLVERLSVPGGLGGIFPAMANAILALRCLGYPDDHPLITGQIREIEALAVEDSDSLHYQPCVSPVWDTALAANALLASGARPDHPALLRAAEWLLEKQILTPGDWQMKRPGLASGGWPFQYTNHYYPDLDDTAMVLMALHQIRHPDAERKRESMERGLRWFLGMQGQDGGWASFDADNNRLLLNHIPFADHGALLDPSTEDLTGRGLELLGTLGYGPEFEPVKRARSFIWRTQRPEGCWHGRWGVNYIYGTWSVLRGLHAIGTDLRAERIRRAVRWLESRQNGDGGWGEALQSYDDPTLAGTGNSTPSQTAWALLALLAAGEVNSPAVGRGLVYLLETQDSGGVWTDLWWNGTGFPRVFYLKYHLYAKYFPLWALGAARQAFRS
ncbi:MAG: squalene--hopene cyclase [Candidatus Rokubacteria bacterium]|nr:squalene--hopene cyclase [Candidatus Rokubacteria bacterium]